MPDPELYPWQPSLRELRDGRLSILPDPAARSVAAGLLQCHPRTRLPLEYPGPSGRRLWVKGPRARGIYCTCRAPHPTLEFGPNESLFSVVMECVMEID